MHSVSSVIPLISASTVLLFSKSSCAFSSHCRVSFSSSSFSFRNGFSYSSFDAARSLVYCSIFFQNFFLPVHIIEEIFQFYHTSHRTAKIIHRILTLSPQAHISKSVEAFLHYKSKSMKTANRSCFPQFAVTYCLLHQFSTFCPLSISNPIDCDYKIRTLHKLLIP